MTTPAPPSLTVTLAIDPRSFSLGAAVELSITAVSHASTPITIFTWPTIFNLRLAQRRKNFTCVDLDTGTPVMLELTKGPKRAGFSREQGGKDDEYFHTFEPGQPVKVSGPFLLAYRQTEGPPAILPGRRYSFEVRDGEQVAWWKEGRREEVLAPPGQYEGLDEASGEPIALNSTGPAEFTVIPSED